jgi:hypothetical protein
MMHCNVTGGKQEIVEEMTCHYTLMIIEPDCFDVTRCLNKLLVADVGLCFC